MKRSRRKELAVKDPIEGGFVKPLKPLSMEPAAVRSRLFRERHPGYNAARQRKWRKEHPERVEARSEKEKKKRRKDPRISLWKSALQRASERNMPFTINKEDIVIPKRCPVLGIPLKVGEGKRTPNSPSLDRKDSRRGYTPDNIVVVSWRVNDIKKDATLEELRRIIGFYEERMA